MQLPFTKEQFCDLFAAYNEALWPAVAALWIASAVVAALLLSSRRPPDRWISALLAAHWAWSALAYHLAFFTRINPAAWVFAAMFLLQAGAFVWLGVVQSRLSFAPRRNAWAPVAWVLIAYSLVYPGINAVQHLSVSGIPTFGVPCPTTIFTAGLLMLATPPFLRVSIIPVIWSVIGGSAAFLLDVRADYALPLAGVALAVFSLQRQSNAKSVPGNSGLRRRFRSEMWTIPGARLSFGLGLLMLAQSLMGLLWPGQYRDVDWIKTTWFGNDWITLVVAVPLLLVGLVGVARGSARGLLLWLGTIGYAAYNYGFYLFGAALNAFFLVYVAAVVLAAVTLIVALADLDVVALSQSLRRTTPVRTIGGVLVSIGGGLAAVWMVMWAAYVFAGRPTPVEPHAFQVVAALDLAVMVPALTVGGILLWRRQPWGYVIAAIASIQGALYLLVLSVNSLVAVRRGLVTAPGELPIWGTLMVFTTAVAVVLLANVGPERATRRT